MPLWYFTHFNTGIVTFLPDTLLFGYSPIKNGDNNIGEITYGRALFPSITFSHSSGQSAPIHSVSNVLQELRGNNNKGKKLKPHKYAASVPAANVNSGNNLCIVWLRRFMDGLGRGH